MTAGLVTSVFRGRSLALAGLALAAMVSTTAYGATIFSSNLSLQTHPGGEASSPTGNNIQLGYDGEVVGITNTLTGGVVGYNFDFQSASSAFLTGAGTNSGATVKLALLPTNVDTMDTQDGGYFLALDSVFQAAPINIVFNGLANQVYTVTFDFAGTQQRGFTGTSVDTLSVSLNGGQTQTSSTGTVPSQGFAGYFAATDTFTTGAAGLYTLSFLASGTPNGINQQPAFTLLDNINISTGSTPPPTPEPSSLILLSTGLVGLGGFVRSRIKKSEPTSL